MKTLTLIEHKTTQGLPLPKDDLTFLYELDAPIQGFGYQKDPRIEELRSARNIVQDITTLYGFDLAHPDNSGLEFIYDVGTSRTPFVFRGVANEHRRGRNPEQDMLTIFECTQDQIAHDVSQINETTKAYVGPLHPGIFTKLQKHGVEHIYTEFPERKIRMETIEVGGKTKGELIKELTDMETQGTIRISDYAKDMLNNPDFTTSEALHAVTIVRLTVGTLFGDGASHEVRAIMGTAGDVDESGTSAPFTNGMMTKLGLGLCPAEMGPHYRLSHMDQPLNEWTYIAMKPITDRDGRPDVFNVVRNDNGLWLNDDWAPPDVRWRAGLELVFSLKASEELKD